jgi:polyisoprenoid-binding protein YceI
MLLFAAGAASLAIGGETINTKEPVNLAIEGGSASFVANTNVPAVSIKGKSTAMKAQATAHRDAEGMIIERIQAVVPVKTLQTGMGLRDEHMRKYIFTTKDGQTPDMVFQAENVHCPAGAQTTCNVAGNLTIRGVSHAFQMPLKLRDEGTALRANGESIIKLSDYGIEQPTQLGVKTDNEVHVRLDFVARPAPASVASAGGNR